MPPSGWLVDLLTFLDVKSLFLHSNKPTGETNKSKDFIIIRRFRSDAVKILS